MEPNPDPYRFDNPFTIDPPKGPIMSDYGLDHFRIDCNNKQAQIELLQSMRRTNVDIQKSTFGLLFRPYSPSRPSTRTNWLIHQQLLSIKSQC